MVLASSQVTAGANMVGRACAVVSASCTWDVSTARAMNPGNASMRPTGVDSSVTKISMTAMTSVRTTSLVGIWLMAITVSDHLAMQVITVKETPMNVLATPA